MEGDGEDVTLSQLLNLALGTPEIGSVNFNCLHEVISEILKHCGIANKTQIPRTLSQQAEAPQLTQELPTSLDSSSSESWNRDGLPVQSGSETEDAKVVERTEGEVGNKEPSTMAVVNMSETSTKSKPNNSSNYDDVHVRNEVAVKNQHRFSQAGIPGTPSENNNIILKRSTDRRESKTPANDMWHVLNVNRRVEAAEAAIQGMTNLIDNIHADVEKLQTTSSGHTVDYRPPKAASLTNTDANSKDHEAMSEWLSQQLQHLDGKISQLETEFAKQFVKLEDRAQLQQDGDVFSVEQLVNDVTLAKIVEKTSNKDDQGQTTNKDSRQQPETERSAMAFLPMAHWDSRASKSRLLFSELSNKITVLERQFDDKLSTLEQLANKKIGPEALEEKCDKSKFEKAIREMKEDMEQMLKTSVDLRRDVATVEKDLHCLDVKHTETETKTNKIAKSSVKLERDVEDLTDNIHRNNSGIVKQAAAVKGGQIDEALFTKLRSTIFEVQEQQSHAQNQIDSLLQEGKNRKNDLEAIHSQILLLEEKKVDKEEADKLMEGKADRKQMRSKLNREQFDEFVVEIDRNLQAVSQKLDGTEILTMKALGELKEHMTTKMDKGEGQDLRGYIETKLKSIKPKTQVKKDTEEFAAGSRKQVLPNNCNCISCDRPVNLKHNDPGAELPYYQPMVKSMIDFQTLRNTVQANISNGSRERAALSKERSKIQNELLQLCGAADLDELERQSNRACGGLHTLVEQHRRNPSKAPALYREEIVTLHQNKEPQIETDVRGRDGQIYKGTLPTIQQRKPVKFSDAGNEKNDAIVTSPVH